MSISASTDVIMIVPCWKNPGYSKSLACCVSFSRWKINDSWIDRCVWDCMNGWIGWLKDGLGLLILGGILSVL